MISAQVILKGSQQHTIQNCRGGVYPHPHKCLNLDWNFLLRSALCSMRSALCALLPFPSPLHRFLPEAQGNKGVKRQLRWKESHPISFADLCIQGGPPAIYHNHFDPVFREAKSRQQVFNSRSGGELQFKFLAALPRFVSQIST